MEQAINKTRDCQYRRTFHSDQGWAYQTRVYCSTLKKNLIFQSMSRKGNCHDNSAMENFFGILKQEVYYGRIFISFEELRKAIQNFIHYITTNGLKKN